MKGTTMEFLDAPPPTRKHSISGKWVEIVAAAKQHPGKWAAVGNYSPGVASQIRAGMYPAFIPEGLHESERRAHMKAYWEVTTRSEKGSRRCEVFLRWLGP
jgi:hypothetical protein